MATIGTATVRVTPDTTALTGSSFRSRMAAVGKVAGAALAGAFIIETKAAVTSTQDLTKSTVSLHKNLGLTNKVASEWAAVAKARGADTTKLGMAFKTLATQISSAGHGSATSIQMFKELGFSQKDIQKAMTDTQFAVTKVADGLDSLPAGADKATIASKLFGRGWQTIAPVLRDGSAAMQEQLDTAQKYGAVLQGKTLKQQEDLLANLRENKIAWQGLQVQLATAVTPALNTVSNQFQKIARINADPHLTGEEKFQRIAHIIQTDFEDAVDFVVTKVLPKLVSEMGQTAPKVAAAFWNGFKNASVFGKAAIAGFLLLKFGPALRTLGGRVAGGLFGGRTGGGGIAGALTTKGSTPANPLFVDVVNQVPGGGGPIPGGGPTPDPRNPSKLQRFGKFLGYAFPIAGTTALGYFLASKEPQNNPATLPGSSTQGGFKAWFDKSPLGQLFNFINQPAPALNARGAGAPTVAGHAHDPRIAETQLRPQIQALAEAGKSVPIDLIKRAGLDPKSLHEAGVAIQGYTRHIDIAGQHIHQFGGSGNKSAKDIDKWADDVTSAVGRVMDRNKKLIDNAQNTQQKVSSAADKQRQNVANSYDNLVKAAGIGMDRLQGMTNDALRALGINKTVNFRTSEQAPTVNTKTGQHLGRQRGGPIPGPSRGDRIPLLAEGGEFVVNARATKRYRGLLESINRSVPRFASGGIVAAGHLAQKMGLIPSENPAFGGVTQGAHVAGSYHYSGQAIDVSGGSGPGSSQWSRYVSAVRRGWLGHGLAEQFYDLLPNYVKNDQIVPGQIGGHSDHIHVAIVSGFAAGMAAAFKKLKRIRMLGPAGSMRDQGQGVLDRGRDAANAYLKKKAATAGGAFGAEVAVGKGMLSLPEIGRLTKAHGGPPIMQYVAWNESGGDPSAVSSAGAQGLWQFLPSTWAGLGIKGSPFDPNAAAEGAHKLYMQQGLTPWSPSQFAGAHGGWNQDLGRGYTLQRGGFVRMPPFAGSFAGGGTVPGPKGAARTAVVHGGERISKPGRYAITITNWDEGRGYMEEVSGDTVNSQIRLNRQRQRMRRS